MTNVDDGSITDDWSLLRRIHPEQIVQDGNTGNARVSSAAFKDPQMSVDVEEMLIASGRSWAASLEGYPDYSLVRLKAGVPRGLGQAVVHVPLPNNGAHAEIRGTKSQAVARALAKAASWVQRA